MSHNGFDLVVPNYSEPMYDIEANQYENISSFAEDPLDEDVLCPCLPSYDTIAYLISHTSENLTRIFVEALYGRESDTEKDL